MLAEAARVLRPGGRLVILNFAYGDPPADPACLAGAAGLTPEEVGTRPLSLWDATAFRFRRPGCKAPLAGTPRL